MECSHSIPGGLCGDEVPGDDYYGDCAWNDGKYSICYSSSTTTNNCAAGNINTAEDCASRVSELITQGICHSNGIFQTSLCDETGVALCVCQLPDTTVDSYTTMTTTWAASTIFRLRGTFFQFDSETFFLAHKNEKCFQIF